MPGCGPIHGPPGGPIIMPGGGGPIGGRIPGRGGPKGIGPAGGIPPGKGICGRRKQVLRPGGRGCRQSFTHANIHDIGAGMVTSAGTASSRQIGERSKAAIFGS